MDFHFKRFDEKLDDIRLELKEQKVDREKRLSSLELDVSNLKAFQVKVLTLWAVAMMGVTLAINKWL